MEDEPQSCWASFSEYAREKPVSFTAGIICFLTVVNGLLLAKSKPDAISDWDGIEIWLKCASDFGSKRESLLGVKERFEMVESTLIVFGIFVITCCLFGYITVFIEEEYRKYLIISYLIFGTLFVMVLSGISYANHKSYRQLRDIHEDHARNFGQFLRQSGFRNPETRWQIKNFNEQYQPRFRCCGVEGPEDWAVTGIPVGCRKNIEKLTPDEREKLSYYIPREDAYDRSCRSVPEAVMDRYWDSTTLQFLYSIWTLILGMVVNTSAWVRGL